MSHHKDKTLLDNNRRLLNLQRAEIEGVLPEYFGEDFPNLITLFDAYYEWMDDSGNPSNQIQKLYRNRDASQVPTELLPYLEDELLLGQAYFGGFLNKREALKFSNFLYRSKGTKYSIEQFFRGFFGVDPQVIYPKENIFRVGPEIDYDLDSINLAGQQIKTEASKLGPESRRFLTDAERYQVMSVLIKSEIPITKWLETYKLFVHPAGAHIAGELVLELVNGNVVRSSRESGPGIPIRSTFAGQFTGIGNVQGNVDITLIQQGDGTTGMFRTSTGLQYGNTGEISIDSTLPYSMRELLSPTSITFDDSDLRPYEFSQDSGTNPLHFETFDKEKYRTLFDSENSADSAHYPFGHV